VRRTRRAGRAGLRRRLKRLGLSVDWDHHYATIDERSRRASQRAFLRNVARGEAYSQEAPTLWDIDFRTAVAQAEMEDRERPGAYHKIPFARTDGGGAIEIDTTRPELLAACVALVAHPDDERFQPYFGTTVTVPLYGQEVEIRAHELAQPDKGTGIAMICTFGDTTDVTWWRELDLPMRAIIGRDGRLHADPPHGVDADAYASIAGLTSKQAQKVVVEQLVEPACSSASPARSSTRSSSTSVATARSRSSHLGSGTSATVAAIPNCARPW
jgi:valyl-tRNA synthetase